MSSDIYCNGEYLTSNPSWHVEDSSWKARQIIKMVRKHNLQPHTVCEIGCGAGEILRQLHTALPDTILSGYDISPQAISVATKRESDRLHFFCEDLLETNTKVFDLVLCIDVLEHVEDCFSFLRRLRKCGRLKLFHIPLDMNVSAVLRCGPIMRTRQAVGHVHYFMKETALATLRDTGYEIIDYFYTPGHLGVGKTFRRYFAIVPRLLLFFISQDLAARVLGGYSLLVLAC
jgi:hypothetical protein